MKTFLHKNLLLQSFRDFLFIEKIALFLLLGVVAISFVMLAYVGYIRMTVEVPASGGAYTEAIFGQPVYFNPLLLRPDSGGSAEASVVSLVYSGLFRADRHGSVEPDLAERVDVSDDLKEYIVHIRRDAQWHDGESVTADDVLFTFHTIQNPQYTIVSSLVQAWSDVKVERIDDYTVKFLLNKPYEPFISAQLRTAILPEHIWKDVNSEAFAIDSTNRMPIGSGPYMIDGVDFDGEELIESVSLKRFKNYYARQSYINHISLSFYDNEKEMLDDYLARKVMGISISAQDVSSIEDDVRKNSVNRIELPSSFGVFLNPLKSAALAYADVRHALSLATDRQAIVNDVLSGEGVSLSGPFTQGMEWYMEEETEFDVEAAIDILEKNGWIEGADGIRAREGTVLRFTLVVPEWESLKITAEKLKEQWRKVGADVQIVLPKSFAEFGTIMEKREYSALLYAQIYFSFDADPFSFWHSTQKESPGRNFAQFSNKDLDKIISDAQKESDEDKREELQKKFNEIIYKNNPAVFLYSPYYIYVQTDRLKGADFKRVSTPSERFAEVSKWYVTTKRVLKKNDKN